MEVGKQERISSLDVLFKITLELVACGLSQRMEVVVRIPTRYNT